MKVALRNKVILDMAVDGDEFLERLHPTEFEHRRLSLLKRLMGILGPIVLPLPRFAAFEVADFHGYGRVHVILKREGWAPAWEERWGAQT